MLSLDRLFEPCAIAKIVLAVAFGSSQERPVRIGNQQIGVAGQLFMHGH